MPKAVEAYHNVSRELMRDELIVTHLEFVRHVLARLVATLPDGVDKENLESAGILGLVEAAQQFDPTRGVPFKTFCYPRVRGAIIDELRRNCPLPQQMLQTISRVRRACEQLEPPVTPEVIAEVTGLTSEEVEDAFVAMRLTRVGFLDEIAQAGYVGIQRDGDAPEAPVEQMESKQVLIECIQRLPEIERAVITMYYLDDLRLKEIGEVIGRSESRVSRILTKAEFRLKEYVRVRMQ